MKKNILITATGGRSVGSGILHALKRTSGEVSDRWNIIATDADPFSWGLYKADGAYLLPFAAAPDYIERVKHIVKLENIDAIIPGSEAEAQVLTLNKADFNVPIIANQHNLMPYMMDKFFAMSQLKKMELPTVETYKLADWEKAIAEYDFPFIIKPTTGTGGSKGVSICSNVDEINMIVSALPTENSYCIQPLIGTEDDEYTVGILSDKDGNLIDSIVMKRKLIGLSLLASKKVNEKNHSISTGYSQGYFIKHSAIQEFCENFAKQIGSKGPLNLQLRIHNGEIYVFEVHPRFSGTSTMRADVGFNEPDILLRNYLFEEKFGRLNYQYNVAAIRAFEHVIVPIDKMIK